MRWVWCSLFEWSYAANRRVRAEHQLDQLVLSPAEEIYSCGLCLYQSRGGLLNNIVRVGRARLLLLVPEFTSGDRDEDE